MSSSWDGTQLREALGAAAHWLARHANAVDALNVFPVPDGDTGTNMALTLAGALDDVPPDPSCAVVADHLRHTTMMRGRGNSGIILSQAFRGLALALAGHQRIGGAELAAALAQASATAYQAVLRPVEGTMLTVLRAASEAARAALQRHAATAGTEAAGREDRTESLLQAQMVAGGLGAPAPALALSAAAAAADSGRPSISEVLEAATTGAREALARTPQLLTALRDAGVVDAGGQGLVLVLEGMLRYARGQRDETAPAITPMVAPARPAASGAYGYCTSFVIMGGVALDQLRAAFEPLGDSLVLAGDERAARVHLHTARPGDALNAAIGFGALDAVEITNMDRQCAALAPPGARAAGAPDQPATGVVAVASGAGFAAIFRSLRAGVVLAGASPSAAELLAAIERLPQREVLILPNDPSGLPAAEQAARLSDRRVEVLPTRSMAHGAAALLSLGATADISAGRAAIETALGRVRVAELTYAARDVAMSDVAARAGQQIALIDGELVAAADDRATLIDQLSERLALSEAEIVTIYYGGALDRAQAEASAAQIATRHPGLTVETHEGGQPCYDMIIAAE